MPVGGEEVEVEGVDLVVEGGVSEGGLGDDQGVVVGGLAVELCVVEVGVVGEGEGEGWGGGGGVGGEGGRGDAGAEVVAVVFAGEEEILEDGELDVFGGEVGGLDEEGVVGEVEGSGPVVGGACEGEGGGDEKCLGVLGDAGDAVVREGEGVEVLGVVRIVEEVMPGPW